MVTSGGSPRAAQERIVVINDGPPDNEIISPVARSSDGGMPNDCGPASASASGGPSALIQPAAHLPAGCFASAARRSGWAPRSGGGQDRRDLGDCGGPAQRRENEGADGAVGSDEDRRGQTRRVVQPVDVAADI